jgi:menaquinone-dependent protoporphyrinogen oxidase
MVSPGSCQGPAPVTGQGEPALGGEPVRVLVAAASRHGATAELAGWVADGIRDALPEGAAVSVRRCADVAAVREFDGVVVGSAVYHGHWLEEAHEFVLRCAIELWDRPVWLFSSGPVGVPPRPPEDLLDVEEILQLSRAREHCVFPGRLDRTRLDFVERALTAALHAPEGDFWDRGAARAWGVGIGRTMIAFSDATGSG